MTRFALTIFLSAFLLFQIQPMSGKVILPWFGGSAAVWNTCLMFFQMALLGGYLYAHCVVRFLRPRVQAAVHILLLGASLLFLRVIPPAAWKPSGASEHPSFGILFLLCGTVGLPYFLLSTTTPLLQAWYRRTNAAGLPYRLFALSNLGSFLALLSYPVLVEPALSLGGQATMWQCAYAAFAVLCVFTAIRAANAKSAEETVSLGGDAGQSPSAGVIALWVSLAACPSVLLLAVTTHLTQNVAPIPLLWVLPLGIYLLSFILCFESDRFYRRGLFVALLGPVLSEMARAIYANTTTFPLKTAILVFSGGLFVCCMVCHGELARLKPHPRHLTLFYLMISSGGALGGLFVALAAPNLFSTYLELPIGIVFCAALVSVSMWRDPVPTLRRLGRLWQAVIPFAVVLALAGYLVNRETIDRAQYRLSMRNFYGTLRVQDNFTDTDAPVRALINGKIIHGKQILDARRRDTPTTYYGLTSGVGLAIKAAQKSGPVRIGVIGLGAGVLASYCRPDDVFRVYEINPLIRRVAGSLFTFVRDCAADKAVLMGDARLTLERQAGQNFDVLAVDAFSGDSIPVHLLTREAMALYFRHLKPGGILAVHVSNRFLDLQPVVAAGAALLGKRALTIQDQGDEEDYLSATTWVLVSQGSPVFDQLRAKGYKTQARAGFRPWTDDYSNLFQIIE